MKKLVPLFLIVLIVLTTCVTMADELITMYVLCKPNDYVNARYLPSRDSEVAGRLDCGDDVMTDGETKRDKQGRKWTHIVYPAFEVGDSWICSMYLQKTPITIEQCIGYVISKGRTALRRSPNGKRTKWLRNGDEVKILAMSEEWALTTRGYVKREFLDVCYE